MIDFPKLTLITAAAVMISFSGNAQNNEPLTFFAIGDWGREGKMMQSETANAMNKSAETRKPDFIISTGDNFYPTGVKSKQDKQWETSFEKIYTGEHIDLPWYVVLGNHDHLGRPGAQVEYSKSSEKWNLPSPYYTFTRKAQSKTVKFIFIDTDPYVRPKRMHRMYRKFVMLDSADRSFLMDSILSMPVGRSYFETLESVQSEKEKDSIRWVYADSLIKFKNLRGYFSRSDRKDLFSGDTEPQTQFIDSVLSHSKADYTIVVGHHPMYTGGKRTNKDNKIRNIFEDRFKKHGVDLYIAGHEHDLQYLDPETGTHHFVSGAGSKLRSTGEREETVFAEAVNGFMSFQISDKGAHFEIINHEGKVIFKSELK